MTSWYDEVPQLERHLIDLATVATVVGTLTNYLPSVSAILAIVWTIIRIYETDTVRSILGKSPRQDKEKDNG